MLMHVCNHSISFIRKCKDSLTCQICGKDHKMFQHQFKCNKIELNEEFDPDWIHGNVRIHGHTKEQ